MRARLLYAGLKLAERIGSRPSARLELPLYRPGISVVIPERANPDVLAECLEHAEAAVRNLAEASEIIVAASGAPESLYRSLVETYPRVRWLFASHPLWYAEAVRRGLRGAQYDWVYLLNNDTMLDAQALNSIGQWRAPDVFAIASQVFFRDPAKRREETGWTRFRSSGGPIEIADEVPDDDVTVRGTFYAGGGASLFRRDLLRRLVRDTAVYAPFYWEDVEWGARAWRLGYASLYCPASRACHWHRSTNRLFFSEAEIDRILTRNRFVFHLRNGPPVCSFEQLLEILRPLDATSMEEILKSSRIARIALGHFQACRLPSAAAALDRTWSRRYGSIEKTVLHL